MAGKQEDVGVDWQRRGAHCAALSAHYAVLSAYCAGVWHTEGSENSTFRVLYIVFDLTSMWGCCAVILRGGKSKNLLDLSKDGRHDDSE